MMPSILGFLRRQLERLQQQPWSPYAIPGAWVDAEERHVFSSPPAYHLRQLNEIERLARIRSGSQTDALRGLTYNALVRHALAYDHGRESVAEGWSAEGTPLKLLSLLPYLHRLGVTTIVLLPIFERGRVGRKGNLGSPYAVRHPFRLDIDLVEPALGMTADDVLRAFVAAAHALGMKVVLEFVLRTASIDSELVYSHPEWFYWIRESTTMTRTFRKPDFTEAALQMATQMVHDGNAAGLPAPRRDYQDQFTAVPQHIRSDEHGWIGLMSDGTRVRIPGAFADWPPNDPQPPWSDVTYLRLHDHPDYRYMAYNTIRYYEAELEQPAYRVSGLWNFMASILPHWIRLFEIDGAMIDMGHALPAALQQRVIDEARALRPDLILLEENFVIGAESVAAGYDAVVGYLPLHLHEPSSVRAFVERAARKDLPVRYFATPETHNTPRAASREGGFDFSIAMWTFARCLPNSVPFLHAGMELAETMPINTGLGFTHEELRHLPAEDLPLFSSARLPWDDAGRSLAAFTAIEHAITSSHWFKHCTDGDDLLVIETGDPRTIAYARITARHTIGIIVMVNMTSDAKQTTLFLPRSLKHVFNAPAIGVRRTSSSELTVEIKPWTCVIIPIWGAPTSGDSTL
jgi:hypothetical protein